MRLNVFIADAAQVDSSGKISALGLGWTTCPSPLPGFALVLILDVDWNETNMPHQLTCALLTEDGQPVMTEGPFGPQPIQFEAKAEAGRPAGVRHGTPTRMPLALTVAPGLALDPGVYQWRVSVAGFDDMTDAESFLVVEPPKHPGIA